MMKPKKIDGIREPVSGSLLYGNNISAPRSYDFGIRRSWIAHKIRAAPNLGRRVTATPETGSTDQSMLGKLYRGTAIRIPLGSKPTDLWKKLYCLKTWMIKSAQLLSVVSYQPKEGSADLREPLFKTLMMYVLNVARFDSPLMSGVTVTNGIPKDLTFSITLCAKIRRNHRTKGSSLTSDSQYGETQVKDDGELVVPNQSSERGSGKSDQNKKDVLSTETSSSSIQEPSEDSTQMLIKKWKNSENLHKGEVKVPHKLIKLVDLCEKNHSNLVFDIYTIFYNRNMYDLAYNVIKSNPGNMTPGSDGSTLDGWGVNQTDSIIARMRDESFQFTPARTVEIPKQDGSKRRLLIAPPKDKVVQRILAWILEAIYEPTFAENSFGFRPQRGCHHALQFIKLNYNGARWFIEGDISKCFDQINHEQLILILRRRIKDEKLIRLIYKALKAGYLDQWMVPKDCIIGTPQGSIISPILCNIFMNQFDRFVLDQLVTQYNRGKSRKQPAIYLRLKARSRYYETQYKKTKNPLYLEKAKEARKQFITMPSVIVNDPDFRRLTYCRYADDWLIGFAGPYTEAVQVRNRCREFLENIKLRLNLEKTLITKASTGCVFLGMKIHVPINQQRFRKTIRTQRASLGVRLNVPFDRVYKKLWQAGYCNALGNKALPRMALYACEKDELVQHYNSIMRGLFNYYSPCDNFKRLVDTLWYLLRSSACKILAAKYKLQTVRSTLLHFGKYLQKGEGNVQKTSLMDARSFKIIKGKFRLNYPMSSRLSTLFRKSNLTIRSSHLECVSCGSTHLVEMHHVRELKYLKKETDIISKAMYARRRKQIPLCKFCHQAKHKDINQIRKGAQEVTKAKAKATAGLK
jgi:group II intron reverse transcriptase/maturase